MVLTWKQDLVEDERDALAHVFYESKFPFLAKLCPLSLTHITFPIIGSTGCISLQISILKDSLQFFPLNFDQIHYVLVYSTVEKDY